LPLAAADSDGSAPLYEGRRGNRGGTSLHRPSGDAEPQAIAVQTRRLDALLPAADVDRVRLVKIDVEGLELEVLRGLEGIYERGARPAIVLEVSPEWAGDGASAAVIEFCERHRLRPYELPREPLLRWRDDAPYEPREVGRVDEQQDWLLVPAT
jgi:Methyltransferase FkbM domain